MGFFTRKVVDTRFNSFHTEPRVGRIFGTAIGAVVGLIVLFGSLFTVDAGERTVILRFGKVNRIAEPGLNIKLPLIEARRTIDVRVRKMLTESDASSKDLQIIHSEIALNYNVQPDRVASVYETIGGEWESRIIEPAIREAFKSVTARYTAEDLIQKRPEVSAAMAEKLRADMGEYGLNVADISITDFDFSEEFNSAIEAKQTAEQHALKAVRDLERIKTEAEQRVVEARGQAEALKVQKQEVTPELIRLREVENQKAAIEKWNGVLPTVTGGGAIPFINVKP